MEDQSASRSNHRHCDVLEDIREVQADNLLSKRESSVKEGSNIEVPCIFFIYDFVSVLDSFLNSTLWQACNQFSSTDKSRGNECSSKDEAVDDFIIGKSRSSIGTHKEKCNIDKGAQAFRDHGSECFRTFRF